MSAKQIPFATVALWLCTGCTLLEAQAPNASQTILWSTLSDRQVQAVGIFDPGVTGTLQNAVLTVHTTQVSL